RGDPADLDGIYTNAENDYLEALVEGGLVRLLFSALTIGLVFRLGYRAVRHRARGGGTGLAMGALFGFATMGIHSFGECGLHIPAIALLATVLSAHLCALGSTQTVFEIRQAARPLEYRLHLRGLAPMAGAVAAVALGLILSYEGWRAYRMQWLRLA